ncbi:MAG: PEP-CTERM sorting domain-containing protein [Akkermansiaceae bacterium]
MTYPHTKTLQASALAVGILAFSTSAHAAVIRYNLQNDVRAGEESLGLELDSLDDPGDDNSASTATLANVTFVASATTSFGDNTAVVNAGGGGMGINTGGGGSAIGDSAAAIDEGEVLTLSISFGLGYTVSLTEIDFGGISDNTDTGTVSIAGGPSLTVFDGMDTTGLTYTFTGFDIMEFNTPISLSSGDTLVFSNVSAGESFEIDSLDLDIVAVPEPSSTALLGLGGLALMMRRRK